jgi:hypothetical protein
MKNLPKSNSCIACVMGIQLVVAKGSSYSPLQTTPLIAARM